MLRIDPHDGARPSARVVTLTPAVTRSAGRGPRVAVRPACLGTSQQDHSARLTCLRDRYLRTLVCHMNDALIDGRTPSIDAIVRRVAPPTCLHDDAQDEFLTRTWGVHCLTAYRDFLRIQRFACIVDSGRHVRTETRTPWGHGLAVTFTGHIDLAAMRADGTLACAFLTQDPVPVASTGEVAATFVFHQLSTHAYGAAAIDVIHVALPSGVWESVRCTPEVVVAGAVQCRDITAVIARDGCLPSDPVHGEMGRSGYGRHRPRRAPRVSEADLHARPGDACTPATRALTAQARSSPGANRVADEIGLRTLPVLIPACSVGRPTL